MHFPWKKKSSRVSRISQLVSGIQSPRNKSLVFETGFPTSLIDLFVKNRDRLKKSSPQWKTQLRNDGGVEISSARMVSSPEGCVIEGETVRNRNGEVIGGIQAVELLRKEQKSDYKGSDNGSELSCVLVWVLKMFLVVVLGLSAKKLVVGITLSTCLLMFVEYLGIGRVKLGLGSVVQRVNLWFVRFRTRKLASRWLVLEEKICIGSELCASKLHCPVGEIEVVDHELDRCGRDSFEEGQSGCSGQVLLKECLEFERKLEVEEEDVVEVMDCKNGNKGSGKMKSKLIKKFMQKKLRYRNRKNRGHVLECACEEQESVLDKDETLSSSHQHTEKGDDMEVEKQDSSEDSLSLKLQELENYMEGSKGKEIDLARSSGELLRCRVDLSAAEEKMQNSGYLLLFLIVLAGLLGGRVLAFVITMAWFFAQKLVIKLSRFDNAAVKGSRA